MMAMMSGLLVDMRFKRVALQKDGLPFALTTQLPSAPTSPLPFRNEMLLDPSVVERRICAPERGDWTRALEGREGLMNRR